MSSQALEQIIHTFFMEISAILPGVACMQHIRQPLQPMIAEKEMFPKQLTHPKRSWIDEYCEFSKRLLFFF